MIEKKVRPVSLEDIRIDDGFWKNYMELIRSHVIPYQWEALNDRIADAQKSYCLQNFRRAAGLEDGPFMGCVFQDSDLYKWLEAVAYLLAWHPDKALEQLADEAIDLIGKAQQQDGYLDTYYIINGLDKRFTNLMDHHELYCLGHMLEAAVAYHQVTGKDRFLTIARRYADCVEQAVGSGEGKIPGYPGHEVAEMALVGLYQVTGEQRYLDLAKYFIDQRGQSPLYFEQEKIKYNNHFNWGDSSFGYQYYQAAAPVRQQRKAQGHAVRAVYLYSGMADVAAETGDQELFAACRRLWDNMTKRQMYITGAIGASAHGESFTFDYDLPNDTVYGETCASIGLIFFARRMFELTGDSRYADVLEQALFNGVISGMSLDGTKFFYVNPLEVVPEACAKDNHKRHVKPTRQKWFGCACCPPNAARLLAAVGSYAFEQNENQLFVNLYVGGEIKVRLNGQEQRFKVATNYPWDQTVNITIAGETPGAFALALRLPGWCECWQLKLNGKLLNPPVEKGYAYLDRLWQPGDTVELVLSMPVKLMQANPRVREDIGKAAVMRGPLVYCLEEADNGKDLHEVYLNQDNEFAVRFDQDLLNGVVKISAQGRRLSGDGWDDELYRACRPLQWREQTLTFIPYYAWDNRRSGEMLVWVRI